MIPNGDVAQGREQIEALLEPQFRAFPDWHIERRGLYACGEAGLGSNGRSPEPMQASSWVRGHAPRR